MKKIAIAHALQGAITHAVQGVMASLFAPAMPAPPTEAERRADRRALKQRALQETNTPPDDEIEVYTRQRARAEARTLHKQLRSMRKEEAMKDNQPGGAAKIRA